VVVVAFLVLALASATAIRFASRHAKDDYRAAAAVAQDALRAGESVWWSADALGALVYDVTLAEGCEGATLLENPRAGFADGSPLPTVVITSKPDIYDAHGALADYLKKNQFRRAATFAAFEVWRRSSTTPANDCAPSGKVPVNAALGSVQDAPNFRQLSPARVSEGQSLSTGAGSWGAGAS
jgi:hypothetical protein